MGEIRALKENKSKGSSCFFQYKQAHFTLIYCRAPSLYLLTKSWEANEYVFLCDKTFNQSQTTFFERCMRNRFHAYYFSSSSGLHYDQFELFRGSKRQILSSPLELELKPAFLRKICWPFWPFNQRMSRFMGISGDFLEKGYTYKNEILKLIKVINS